MSHVLAGADEIIEYSPYRMGLLQMLRSGIGTWPTLFGAAQFRPKSGELRTRSARRYTIPLVIPTSRNYR